jgi:Uma2 family endonuclease
MIHPAPDLAVEIDITRRSVPREPVYAELGVRELWRFDGERLIVLLLQDNGNYKASLSSPTFPFLPLEVFETFIARMDTGEQSRVLREFRKWVGTLRS